MNALSQFKKSLSMKTSSSKKNGKQNFWPNNVSEWMKVAQSCPTVCDPME